MPLCGLVKVIVVTAKVRPRAGTRNPERLHLLNEYRVGARALRIYTIGFTKKSASDFFELLRGSGAQRLVDVRLNNASQLAGFARGGEDNLAYLLQKICRMKYIHAPDLAPTKALLDGYRDGSIDWETYERDFLTLLDTRRILTEGIRPTGARRISSRFQATMDNSCLLCSEHEPDHCHRRLVAEYFKRHWGDVQIEHLI